MSTPTANFRRQHDELVSLAEELAETISAERTPERVARVQSILNRLAGKLKVHKAMEEEALYPNLLAHEKLEVRELAGDFLRQFGTVYQAFLIFRDRWNAERMGNDYDGFTEAAKGLIAALADRINHENGELYELVDELYGGS